MSGLPPEKARTPVYVTGLAYELGEHVHDLDELALVLPGVRASLRESGLKAYRTSDRAPAELAKVTLAATLAQLDPPRPGSIRHVIYATNSMWDAGFTDPATLGSLLVDLGLEAAYPYGIFLSYCANLHCAFDLGAAIIRSAETDRVLVVCTDKADPRSDRLVQPRISVHSDGAASFVLTRDQTPGSYRLIDTVLTINPRIGAIDADRHFIEYFHAVTEGIALVVEKALSRTGLAVGDVARVFTNNYNEMISTIVAKLIGFGGGQLYLDNIPRFAHSLAADAVINLADCAAASPWAGGELLLVLGTGPIQWACSILETVP